MKKICSFFFSLLCVSCFLLCSCEVESYSEEKYTVSFEGSELTCLEVDAGNSIKKPQDPVKEYADFEGWFADSAYTIPFDWTQEINSNTKIYAKWNNWLEVSPIMCRFGFDAGSLDSATSHSENYIEHDQLIFLSALNSEVKVYYSLGEQEEKLYGGEGINPGFDVKKGITQVTIKAYGVQEGKVNSEVFETTFKLKTYDVEFNDGKGNSAENVLESKKIFSGEKLFSPAAPENPGYKFIGWYEKEAEFNSGRVVAYEAESKVTVYAKWQLTGVLAEPVADVPSGSYDLGQEICLSINSESEGKELSSIYITTDGSDPVENGTVYNGLPIVLDKDITVKAVCKSNDSLLYKNSAVLTLVYSLKKYEVSFETGAGASVVEGKTVCSGDKVSKPEAPVNSTKNFTGWFVAGSEYDFNSPVTGNLVIEAHWIDKEKVNSPVIKIADVVVADGSKAVDSGTEISLSIPGGYENAKIKYTVDGSDPLANGVNVAEDTVLELTEGIKLRAVSVTSASSYLNSDEISCTFSINVYYTVTFDLSGGEASPAIAPQVILKGGKATVPGTTPSKDGYDFVEWVDQDDNAFDFDTVLTGNVSLKASWYLIPDTTPPSAVSGLSAQTGTGFIKVNWTDPLEEDFAYVKIVFEDASGTEGESVTILKGVESYVKNSGITYGNHIVTVTAYDDSDNASVSEQVTVKYYEVNSDYYHIVDGDTAVPSFRSLFTDNLLISSHVSGGDKLVWLSCVAENVESYTWYVQKNGNWVECNTDNTDSFEHNKTKQNVISMRFKPSTWSAGTTKKYMVVIRSAKGSYIGSNVCTVELGTEKTQRLGNYYYSDGTYSSSYKEGKTLVGIVADVNSSGIPSKIVSLTQESRRWTQKSSSGYNRQYICTLDDGLMNWKMIQSIDKNREASDYGAFVYAEGLKVNSTDPDWYLPACGELLQVYANSTYFDSKMESYNSALGRSVCTTFGTQQYWSSTDVSTSTSGHQASIVYFDNGYPNANDKYNSLNIRAMARIGE